MKMFKLVVVALAALLLVAVRAGPLTSWAKNFVVIQLEEPCVRQGGICMRHNECDPDNVVTASRNLCPDQQHLGVQCCYI